jgi:hypothetical protein
MRRGWYPKTIASAGSSCLSITQVSSFDPPALGWANSKKFYEQQIQQCEKLCSSQQNVTGCDQVETNVTRAQNLGRKKLG